MYRIIAADDEPMMRRGLKALVDWEFLGCELTAIVGDGQAALDAVDELHPDILICDIKMPKKSGIEVARSIYERHLPVAVILLTAYADFSYAQQAIQYGVSDYVTKTGAVDGIAEAIRKCRARLEESRVPARVRGEETVAFLKAVLEGTLYGSKSISGQAAALHLDLAGFTLLLAQIDLPDDAEQAMRLTASVRDMLEGLGKRCCLVPLGRDRLCAIMPGALPGTLFPTCQELARAFSSLSGRYLSIGVSERGHGASALPGALGQAGQALEQRFYGGRENAVCLWDPDPGTGSALDTSPLLEEACSAICRANEAEALEALEKLFALQQGSCAPPDQARGDGIVILNACKKYLGGVDGADLPATARTLMGCRFFKEYKALLAGLVADACRAAITRDGNDVVTQAQRFIEVNYCRSVTLGEIAAAVHANPSYLSRIFKSRTGASVVETINRKKMGRAMELLRTGSGRICEVAESVGIADTTYFSHLFRKYTGLSPTAYQERFPNAKP